MLHDEELWSLGLRPVMHTEPDTTGQFNVKGIFTTLEEISYMCSQDHPDAAYYTMHNIHVHCTCTSTM